MDLTIHIPGNILPVDRGKQFADPLDSALRAANLGQLRDEGTQMGIENGQLIVVGCDLFVRVSDVAAALAVIRRVLRELVSSGGHDSKRLEAIVSSGGHDSKRLEAIFNWQVELQRLKASGKR